MASKKITKVQQDIFNAQKSEIVKIQQDVNIETLKAVEDQLLRDSVSIVQDCLDFADMGFDSDGHETIPEAWNDLPDRDKARKIRLAKATWMTSAEVPHGIKMAYDTMMGIIKSRAVKESGAKVLNIENASFPSPSPLIADLEIIDVEE